MTGEAQSFEVRIIPDQQTFRDIGNVTTFTPGTADFPDPGLADGFHTFQVRAVGTGDRKDAIGSLDFTILTLDTIPPTVPGNLTEVTTGDELVRIFTWVRSVDPVPPGGTTGDESGVDFYNVVITGVQILITTTADASDSFCLGGLCRFTTSELSPGQYKFQVSAVDGAGNESLPATADFRAGSLGAVQNLRVVDAVVGNTFNTPNPKFRWGTPQVLAAGLKTYEVAITGDPILVPAFNIPFTPFTEDAFFLVECFGSVTGSGDQCAGAVATGDEIEITVKVNVPEGMHLLGVRVVPAEGEPGEPVALVFTVDITPPAPEPTLIRPESGERINDNTPFFEWTPSAGDVVDYLLRVTSGDINLGPFAINVVVEHPITGSQATAPLADETYQWIVIARDAALNTASSIIRAFTVDATPPAPAPTLVRPEIGKRTNDNTPFFEWIPSSGDVVDYLLQVTSGDIKLGPFAIDVVVLHPITGSQATAPLADDTYQWRVVARDLDGLNTASSIIQPFTVDTTAPALAPVLIRPESGDRTNDNTPFFEWTPSSGDVVDYLLQVTSGDINLGPFAIDVVVPDPITGSQSTTPLADDTYQWRVIARDGALNTASSIIQPFTVDTQTDDPVLVSPIAGVTLGTQKPKFVWDHSDPSVPVTYNLRVTTGDINLGPFVININTGDLFFDPNVDLPVDPVTKIQDYKWSVRATDSLGNQSAPSTADFTIDANAPVIELLSPLGIVTLSVDTFQWRTTGDTAASSYDLQIDNAAGDFTSPLQDVTLSHLGASGDIQVHVLAVPLGDGNYKWRVRGTSTLGVTGGFTEASFNVDLFAPGVPLLLAPPNDARISDNTPTFDWTDVVDTSGVTYLLQVIKRGIFFVNLGDLADSQFTVQPLDDGTYLWRVQAKDGAGKLGSFSAIFSVTIDTTPPDAPLLDLPPEASFLNDKQVLFRWIASTSPDTDQYRLQVVKSGDPFESPFFAINELVATTQIIGDLSLQPDGAFNWRVGALDIATPPNETDPASLEVRQFSLDTVNPTRPEDLLEVTTGSELVRVFTWKRSTDPGFIALDNPLNTGSGVDFYSVVITGPQNEVATADDGDTACPGNICTFATQPLVPGLYVIDVRAVDRATNESLPSTTDFRGGRVDVVQNLRVVDSVVGNTFNIRNPAFRWNPPQELPEGLKTYEVAITGDPILAPAFNIPFTPFTGDAFFFVECFGSVTGTGDQCAGAVATGDVITITVKLNVPDGTHLLGVRVVPAVGEPGEPVSLAFTVDATPPAPPELLSPADEAAFLNINPPLFDWAASPSLDVVDYRLQVVVSGDDFIPGSFTIDELVEHPTTTFQTGDLADNIYRWRVIARDAALNTSSSATRSFTVLEPRVDLRLLSETQVDGVGTTFAVTIKVEPNGNPVDTVDAFLDFNTGDLKAVAIAPGPELEGLLIGTSDNARGTVDFGALTFGEPNTGDFVLAVVTFEAINSEGTDAATIDFSKEFPRKTEVAFKAVPLLRNVFPVDVEIPGLKVDIELKVVPPGLLTSEAPFPVTISVRPNGQAVSTVAAFLNFDTQHLEVLNIEPGPNLEAVLEPTFDNANGSVAINALTFGQPLTGDFELAVVTFTTKEPESLEQLVTIGFDENSPRKSDATFKGASVLSKLIPVELTILKPTVDILLGLQVPGEPRRFFKDVAGFEGFAFASGDEFSVPIRVESNGQRVSAVDALLDFDPSALNVLRIDPGSTLEQVIVNEFDNVLGTIDFSADTTGLPATQAFDLAVITFQALGATESLSVGFHDEFPRGARADFNTASVLRELIGFPVEIVLGLRLNNFEAPFEADVVVQVRPNGNRVSAVDAFLDLLDVDPTGLEVVSLFPGSTLENVLSPNPPMDRDGRREDSGRG